jgi:formate hydrogenlyase subunit 3/multisubunit Na+/H+ antiporter MnhD subunit
LNQILGILPTLIPICGAAASFVAGIFSRRARDVTIVLSVSVALGITTYMLSFAMAGNSFAYGTVTANAAGLLVAEITLLVGFFATLYAISEMKRDNSADFFHMILLIFIGSMTGLTLSFNLVTMFAFLEISTAAGGVLILFSRTRNAISAAVVYIILSIIGALCVLIGIFVTYTSSGTILLSDPKLIQMDSETKMIVSALFMAGFSVKAGIIPFGLVWLPRAHSEAPTPVSALLSGILVQCAAFAMIRSVGPIALSDYAISTTILVLGVASALVGAICATLEVFGAKVPLFGFRRDLKRILAFSTISEVGVIFVIVGVAGQPQFSIAIVLSAALIHILSHALAKSLLFLSAGNVVHTVGTRDLSKLGGLAKKMPFTTFSFIIGGLSLSSIPPLLGYRTIYELYIEFFNGEVNALTSSIIIAAGITLAFYLISFYKVFFRKNPEVTGNVVERNVLTLVPIAALDVILLVLGLGLFFGVLSLSHALLETLGMTVIGT